jgi:hypothetical protein
MRWKKIPCNTHRERTYFAWWPVKAETSIWSAVEETRWLETVTVDEVYGDGWTPTYFITPTKGSK